ncbi:argonaute-like protein [Irpex rosettiformis]|uniref:Argonaute-like protein n=1 Tax=Irpex rosettiformis TaxID=378272 RepID=A0ACB8UCG2_9APHY|nr:argonaute-like protein [Irpex rosettiformis]
MSGRARGRGARGGGGAPRGGAAVRGGPAGRGGGAGAGGAGQLPAAHVQTTGVKRKGFGTSGQVIEVWTNHFPLDIPQDIIHHYDVSMTPSEQTNPLTLNMELIRHLQEVIAPNVFTPPAVYDGRKNMFAIRELPFTEGSMTFDVSLPQPPPTTSGTQSRPPRAPKVHKIKLTKVAVINPEITARFLEGKQSHDNEVLTTITALNVVVRHEPTMIWPFNIRSFFTDRETVNIGSGIVLWRGYFQSVRPGQGRMFMNIDISTGAMYRPGSLIELMLDFLGRPLNQPQVLAPSRGFPPREHQRLQRFIQGAKIRSRGSNSLRSIKKLSTAGANNLRFQLRDGPQITVAQYFAQTYNKPLAYPELPCVELHSGALIPVELCTIPKGQIMRKQVPPERTKDVLNFATKKPADRLQSIRDGLGVLQYGQSEYVKQFGLHVHEQPQAIRARVLPAPMLKYGVGSKQPTITPRDGGWNMIDKKFYQPKAISRWGWVIYEREQRFNRATAQQAVANMVKACRSVGMLVSDERPEIMWASGQGRVFDHVKEIGGRIREKTKGVPELLVFVLPDGAADTYTAIKHVGDVVLGVATQCLKSSKAFRANDQYFANVCLKLNVKLGGINTIPDARSVSILTDPHNPTLVMGADVIHPAAHSEGRPSFTALVANVDSDHAKYVATSRVQTSRQEMIDDLADMAEDVIKKFIGYRKMVEKVANAAPKRIIFYRDGVSEGQFRQVLEKELPLLQAACKKVGVSPRITVIVVGKRHHVRFFPKSSGDADRSGNCKAGTVVDTDIAHPTEFDFYLQSHGGLLGTSRPAHYNVLYDENDFTVDGLQSLSFTLCHVYARSTRSVSIPAPVYYADIVCSRAKNHYSPDANLDFSEGQTVEGSADGSQLQAYKQHFKPIHPNSALLMYFS